MKHLLYWFLAVLCTGTTSSFAQVANTPPSRIDKRAFREELARGDVDKVWQRLEQTAMDESGQAVDSFKLCQSLMIIQSSHEAEGYRNVLNPVMRQFLAEVGNLFPSDLKRENRNEGEHLVLMGKLYEKYLEDTDEAKTCYLKVVNRFLGSRSFPVSTDDWKRAVQNAEALEKLNADELYAFKRLTQMRQLEETIANRIAYAKEQEAFKAEMAAAVQPVKPDFNPDDSVPFEELRNQLLSEGGRP